WSDSLARNAPSLTAPAPVPLLPARRSSPVGGPVRRAGNRILRGNLRPVAGLPCTNDPLARSRPRPAQARRRIIEGLCPPAAVGAGAADAAAAAAHGRAVRRLRPAAN